MTVQVTPVNSNKPVSLALVKEHLRVIGTDEDLTINLYIDTASQVFEQFAGVCLINKTVEQRFDQFPCEDYFLLERGRPLVSFTSIQYFNKSNVLTTFDASKYIVSERGIPPSVSLSGSSTNWASDIHDTRLQAVKLTYVSGFGTSDTDIPADIKAALLLIIGDLYANKEDTILMPGIGSINVSWHSLKLLQKYKSYFSEHPSQSRKLL